MEILASLFVGRPLAIFGVALAFGGGYLWRRSSGSPHGARPLLVVSLAWAAYAAWEWVVQVRTPGADIRVDLLLIWPILALLSAWGLFRALRRARPAA